MKFATTILGAALGAFLSLAASAEPIPLPPGFIQLSDNDAEYLINADGSRCTSGGAPDCTVDVGDRLRGIFDINSIEGLLPPTAADFTPFNGNELTAIFDITVTSKTGGPGAWTFNFAPTGNLDVNGSGILMYYDPLQDYTRLGCATVAICEATATNGTLWAGFGFGPGSYWIAQAPTDNIADIGAIPPPTQVGGYNAALDFTVNNTGYTFLPHLCVLPFIATDMADACASGGLLGVGDGTDTPFDSFSNVDFTLRRTVPEPASLALLGLGLAAVGFARRKFS
jgi:hypothetical protein